MADPNEWLCPLPVIRKHYDDETDSYELAHETCGEIVYVRHEEHNYLLRDGESGACGPTWRVECLTGHVLILPEHDDDVYSSIPFEFERVNTVLEILAAVFQPRVVAN